mgnify:FL=1
MIPFQYLSDSRREALIKVSIQYLTKLVEMTHNLTLRLPKELNERLEYAIKKGRAVTKTELIRRAIDEFIHNHPELFEK